MASLPSWQMLDYNQPLNLAHPLNKNRDAWWLAMPGIYGSRTWYDLVAPAAWRGVLTAPSGFGWNTNSNPGGSGSFRGNGSSTTILTSPGYPGVTGTAARSCAIWFRTSLSGNSNNNYLYGWGTNAAGQYWRCSVESGVIWCRAIGGATGNWGSGFNDDKWHRCVLTFPAGGTMSSVNCYVDGKLLTGTYAGGTTALNTGTTFSVGIAVDPQATTTTNFNGRVNDFTVWKNRVLSAADVWADYWLSQEGYPDVLTFHEENILMLSPVAAATPAVLRNFVSRPRFEPAFFE